MNTIYKTQPKWKIPEIYLRRVTRVSSPLPITITKMVKKGELPNTILFDFKGILKKHYPELLHRNTKLAETERKLLDQYGFSPKGFTKLVNNTSLPFYYEIFQFLDMIRHKVDLELVLSMKLTDEEE